MSATGRFYVVAGGRRFCIEPLHERGDARNGSWGHGAPRSRGSIAPEDSIITEENGYANITVLPPGVSPIGYIEALLRERRPGDGDR